MAARRLYDPPNVQLVRLLGEARAEGLSFDEAWARAVRPGRALVMSNAPVVPEGALKWPTDRTDREAWRQAIADAREGWRRAYDREPPRASEIALGVLADSLGILERVADDRAAAEGIADEARLLSVA